MPAHCDMKIDDEASDAGVAAAAQSANDLVHARLAGRLSRRTLLRRAAELGLAAPVVGVLLHATGDAAYGASGPARSRSAEPFRAAQATIAASARTKPSGKARAGGTVTAGVVGPVDTLHPYLANLYGPAGDALSGVTEGLLAFDSRQRLRPALAERFEISDDGLTYTFHLRRNVTFHNGDAFTAADVVNSWKMIVDPAFPAWSRLGWEKIRQIDTPDDFTAVITTKEIYAPFLSTIGSGAFNVAAILPSSQLGKGVMAFVADAGKRPIGTGSLRFDRRDGDRIVLARFKDYWGSKAKLDSVIVRVFPENDYAGQLAAFQAGEIQIAARTGIPGASLLPAALTMPDAKVLQFPGLTWGHLDLKNVGFLQETKVRQALDFATPVDQIIAKVLGGEATPAFADQAPGSWTYHGSLEPRPTDLSMARRLLSEATFEAGADGVRMRGGTPLEIELWGEASDPQAKRILDLVAESWAKIGVKTRVRLANRELLWGPTGYQFSDKMTAAFFRWSNANDPDDMFYWHSSQIPLAPGGRGGNLPAYFRPYGFQKKMDDLTSRAAAETDPARRKDLYWKIQELLYQETPVIFMFWDRNYSAVSPTVGGYWPSAFTYLLWNAKDWYVTG